MCKLVEMKSRDGRRGNTMLSHIQSPKLCTEREVERYSKNYMNQEKRQAVGLSAYR
jgi:hypothetical protein